MSTEEGEVQKIQLAFISFALRAEKASTETLIDTFVDTAPLLQLFSNSNNSITYGRRGTGKTHALRYLQSKVRSKAEEAIYLDLRSVGSNTSIYSDRTRAITDRASQLLHDVLEAVLSALYQIAVSKIEVAIHPAQISLRLDDLQKAIGAVKVIGTTEFLKESSHTSATSEKATAGISVSNEAGFNAQADRESRSDHGDMVRKIDTGEQIRHLDFGSIQSALSGLLQVLGVSKFWLLIDEWSEIPSDLQPYLADLLRRTFLPIENCVLKIAAIEHRSNFRMDTEEGGYIGLELGADITANINLDDFLVFDAGGDRSVQFFKNLLFKHYKNSEQYDDSIDTPERLIQTVFTQTNVFAEFVRAVEGVPRDALNLATTLGTSAFGRKITMQDVKSAARDWYQRDKYVAIKQNEKLARVLNTIIDEVLKNRKSRAFLFDANVKNNLLESLFDARLLHILKKNVSSHDEPGARYDVFKIDYGCYVDLISTSNAPLGLYQADEVDEDLNEDVAEETVIQAAEVNFVEVPRDDYRSIRRAILKPGQLA